MQCLDLLAIDGEIGEDSITDREFGGQGHGLRRPPTYFCVTQTPPHVTLICRSQFTERK